VCLNMDECVYMYLYVSVYVYSMFRVPKYIEVNSKVNLCTHHIHYILAIGPLASSKTLI
jgi:hypothetical protein